jgi:hypothetical protein
LIWDPKLTWKPHIASIKTNCQKSINLLKSVTAQKWGADQETSLMIYRSLIRSRLDYGSIVYQSASNTTLGTVNSIANEALRIATGVFKSTPINSIYILANELPLSLRREKLSLKYYFKIRSYINNPAYEHVIDISEVRQFANKKIPPPFSIRVNNLITEMHISKSCIKPSFSYNLLGITTPSYMIEPPEINLDLLEYSKQITPNNIYILKNTID